MYEVVKKFDAMGEYEVYSHPDKKHNPKISVIMSCFNSSLTLSDSVYSVLNQTMSDFELIITNDGSSDSTLDDLLDILKVDDRVMVINQSNLGLTKSLNRMIDNSCGEYVARQDADDMSLANRLQLQYSALEESDANLCLARFIINDRVLPKAILFKKFDFSLLKYGNFVCHGTFFAKRSLFMRKYNSEYKYAQDIEFLLRNKDNIKVELLNDVVYQYSINDNQISIKKRSEQFDFFCSAVKNNLGVSPIRNDFLRKTMRYLVVNAKGMF